ncbi:hypothetical protein FN846DRAFT_921519 [Sphaerosporella brunnea]|uniref:Uncharacterized protein n=1 Tax=Sphaerosporella brunnea TaxID=1250544 RepID=A0A5J5ELT7_9PEZI|nr:hypothetical protein FN846DRAFT_921519 [Sphaerosporella brunnea]
MFGLELSSTSLELSKKNEVPPRFREEVPRARKGNNAGPAADASSRETTEPEVDEHDSGTEGDTESDAEEGSSPKRRKKKAGSSSDNKKPLELVRCCHCSKTWGPYKSWYKTTSPYKRNIASKHPKLPCNDASEKGYDSANARQACGGG